MLLAAPSSVGRAGLLHELHALGEVRLDQIQKPPRVDVTGRRNPRNPQGRAPLCRRRRLPASTDTLVLVRRMYWGRNV